MDTPVIMALLVHQALIRARLVQLLQWVKCRGHQWHHLGTWDLECINKANKAITWDLLVILDHLTNKCTGQAIRACHLPTEAPVDITCDLFDAVANSC